jgi:hypothetical protein
MENPLGKRRVQRRSFQIITSVFFKKKEKPKRKKKEVIVAIDFPL